MKHITCYELEKEFVAESVAWLTDRMVSAAYFERVFSLPTGTVKKWLIGSFEAEAVALLRLVRVCPWLLSVADSGFDPDVARQEVVHEALKQIFDKHAKSPLLVKTIPSQGSEGIYNWPLATLRPHETLSVSLEMQLPFILEWILIAPVGDLKKISVVDLYSGDHSLFVSTGPFPGSMFGEKGWGPTFGSTVTKLGEKLVLKVANLSDDEVTLRSAVFGRGFNTYQEAIEYLGGI